MGAGLNDMISSYNSSLSCSRLMSSLCTKIRNENGLYTNKRQMSYDRTRRTRGREEGQRVHLLDHAKGHHDDRTQRNKDRDIHMLRGMGEPVLLLQLSASLDRMSAKQISHFPFSPTRMGIPMSLSKSRPPSDSRSGIAARMVDASGKAELEYNHVIDVS
jgi:hypothetical protein